MISLPAETTCRMRQSQMNTQNQSMLKPSGELSANGAKLGAKGRKQRQEIIRIAQEIIEVAGLDGLVMRQVANQASIKLGHLQYYFQTKDDLLEALVYELYRNDEAAVLAGYASGDIEVVFRELMDLWDGTAARIYMSIFEGTGQRSRFRDIKRLIWEEFYEILVGLFKVRHPHKSRAELLLKAKRVTAMLDGTALQVYSSIAATAGKQKKQLREAVLVDLLNIVDG